MVLFRSAVKQIAQRHGYHATFMCRPRLPNVMSSGWHLHQSLIDRKTGANAFMPTEASRCRDARHALHGGPARACARRGGLLHADAQRLQALPALLAGARPRHLGPRQPRRHGARAGRRRAIPRRGWRTGSASPRPTPTSTWRRSSCAAWTASTASSIPARPPTRPTRPRPLPCRAPWRRRWLRWQTTAPSRGAFGDFFVAYYLRLKHAEIARFNAEVQRLGAPRVFRAVLSLTPAASRAVTRARRSGSRSRSPRPPSPSRRADGCRCRD